MNNNILIAFILAFIITFSATPFVKKLAFKIGAVDIPKDSRRMHKKPTARLGGLAIFFGFIISALLFSHINMELAGMLFGCSIIVILGVFDDIYALSAKLKLLVQIAAALCPVLAGVRIDFIRVPSIISEYGYIGLGWMAIPITLIAEASERISAVSMVSYQSGTEKRVICRRFCSGEIPAEYSSGKSL